MVPRPQRHRAVRRKNPRSAYTIYDAARGDGWVLTAYGGREHIDGGHRIEVILYFTGDQRVETERVRNTRHHHGVDVLLRQDLNIGAKLGPYEGARPEANVAYEDQPRAVRMQRHAHEIYEALGHARGMSPTIAVKAAETFGSTWAEKGADEWQDRISGVGAGRAERIAQA